MKFFPSAKGYIFHISLALLLNISIFRHLVVLLSETLDIPQLLKEITTKITKRKVFLGNGA